MRHWPRKPRLLDLFCGAGGAGTGYHRAGFEVVGVDKAEMPRYPFEFHQGDALEYLAEHGREFDVIHASPPCQVYSRTYVLPNVGTYEDLLDETRALLLEIGKPYVMENVEQAPLLNPLVLCGSMFGLPLIRHRKFECRPPVWFPPGPCQCRHLYTHSGKGQYSAFKHGATAITVAGNNYCPEDGRAAMGIDWMSRSELSEAIPPVYTEYIGRFMMEAICEKTLAA